MKDQLKTLVLKTISDLNQEWNVPELANINENTILFAPNGSMDSLALVTLIVELEARIYEEMGASITLANEKAMSQKISPFRSVRSLVSYTEELLSNTNHD